MMNTKTAPAVPSIRIEVLVRLTDEFRNCANCHQDLIGQRANKVLIGKFHHHFEHIHKCTRLIRRDG